MLAKAKCGVKLLACLLLVTGIAFGAEWSSGTTYGSGSANRVTWKSGTWVSLQASNTNHEPVMNSAWWAWEMLVFEVDGASQTNTPVVIGRTFPCGMITDFPQPVANGTPMTTYQENVKNRCPDGTVQFAIVSWYQTISSAGTDHITFQNNVTGAHTGGLTKAQAVGFNSTHWQAKIVVTPINPVNSAAAKTVDFKTMLNASDPRTSTFGDCTNNVWLDGPVVTAFIVQDCTPAYTYDFGWLHASGNMDGGGSASYVTTSVYATLHPMATLYFFPTTNDVKAEMVLELPWTTKWQDQQVTVAYQTGDAASTFYTKTNFLALAGGRYRKIGWSRADQSNTPQANLRFDWNFASLVNYGQSVSATSSFLIPNHDPDPNLTSVGNSWFMHLTQASNHFEGITKYTDWAANSTGAKGDIAGTGGFEDWTPDGDLAYGSNMEGAPTQREDLMLLYNMRYGHSCDDVAAQAWQMEFGLSGACDTTVSANDVAGGAGWANNMGNVPFHMRDTDTAGTGQQTTTHLLYASKFADPDVFANATCTSVATCNASVTPPYTAHGHILTRHAHSDLYVSQQAASGCGSCWQPPSGATGSTAGGWTVNDGGDNCDHWINAAWIPYHLTGSYFSYEEQLFASAYCAIAPNTGNASYSSLGFFAFQNYGGSVRGLAYSLYEAARGAAIVPNVDDDGVTSQTLPEAQYFSSFLDSNFGIVCGMLGITCPSGVQPVTVRACGAGVGHVPVDSYAVNRYEFGKCNANNKAAELGGNYPLTSALHLHALGDSGNALWINSAVATTQQGQNGTMATAVGLIRELGFSHISAVQTSWGQGLIEKLLSTDYNPYLIQMEEEPTTNVNTSTWDSGNFLPDYATLKTGYVTSSGGNTIRAVNAWASGMTPPGTGSDNCGNHGYGLSYFAGSSFLPTWGITTPYTTCAGGTCTAADARDFMEGTFPYFNNTPTSPNVGCGTNDKQIKYALLPRPDDTVTVTSCDSLSPSTATISILGTQAFTAICTYSDSSTGSCTSSLSLSSGTPSVATVSSQTATGVGAGSSTISGTVDGHACGNTSALTVSAATGGSAIKPGVKLTSGTILK